MITDLLSGLLVSVEIFVFTLLVALPLGFPIALGRMSPNRFVSGVLRLYISVVRGTPLMLQIIFVYFAPYIFKDTSLAFTIAVAEILTVAKQLSSANTTMMPLITAGVFYYIFNYIVAFGLERIERRFSYYD